MIVRENQVPPWHFHWTKMEDIINYTFTINSHYILILLLHLYMRWLFFANMQPNDDNEDELHTWL